MGAWDLIVTEPPHNGTGPRDMSASDNQTNQNWLRTVSSRTGLPIVIWQTDVHEANPYLGDWPASKENMGMFAQNGVVAVLWDANSERCSYVCDGANDLNTFLANYATSPMALPENSICR
jgi:hypothetical protein